MNSHESEKSIDEVRLLFPWYITGTLSAEERQRVDDALERSPELRQELLQEKQMMQLVKDNTSLLELTALDTTEQRLAHTLARIEHEERPAVQEAANPKNSFRRWLSYFFSKKLFNVEWLSPANAVFASLLICQLGFFAYTQHINNTAIDTTYSSASFKQSPALGDGEEKVKSVFLLEFENDAKYDEVCDFLNQWNANIVSGPNGSNLFSVEMKTDAHTDVNALADNIMQQARLGQAPVLFIGPQYPSE